MKTRLSSAGALVAGAALAASALLATTGPAQAADTATITVTVIDQFGQPASSSVLAVDPSGNPIAPSDLGAISTSHVFQNLPAGGYSFVSQGPWSGFECFGIAPCAIGPAGFPPGTSFSPVVTVAEGGVASYTVHVIMPTVTGGPAVGAPLTIQMSPGYKYMASVSATQSGKSGEHTQQWLRGTADIPAATGPSYVTAAADATQQVSARLTPSPAVVQLFALNGNAVQPFTTRPVAIAKASTRTTTVFLAGGVIRVKVKAAPDAVPDGKIKLSLGTFKAKAKLRNGKTTVPLPPGLAPGKYALKVTYLGSATFEKSKSKKKTLTIR